MSGGKTYLILPDETPNEIGVAQLDDVLIAISHCCMAGVFFAGDWRCGHCRAKLSKAPNGWGETSQHSLAHVAAGTPKRSQRAIKHWTSKWTGVPINLLNVEISV